VNCEVVGMCVEAVPVLDAESVDFLFNWCDLKILSEDHFRHLPWCIGYHEQDFPWKRSSISTLEMEVGPERCIP
jgi:hypothetical protein